MTWRQAPHGAVGSDVGVKTTTARITSGPAPRATAWKMAFRSAADRQTVRSVFDVAAGEDLAAVREEQPHRP